MGFICLKKHLFLVFFEKMSESSDYNIYIYIYIFFFLKNMHYCYLQVDSNLFSEYTTVNFFLKSLQKKKKKKKKKKKQKKYLKTIYKRLLCNSFIQTHFNYVAHNGFFN